MSFVAQDPGSFEGKVVGDGQCVAFVRAATSAPETAKWKEGAKAKGNTITKGVAIATFVDGVYPSASTGNHAAIYVSQDAAGITVWDQWKGQPVHKRVIRFKGTGGSNDGDAFSVIE